MPFPQRRFRLRRYAARSPESRLPRGGNPVVPVLGLLPPVNQLSQLVEEPCAVGAELVRNELAWRLSRPRTHGFVLWTRSSNHSPPHVETVENLRYEPQRRAFDAEATLRPEMPPRDHPDG